MAVRGERAGQDRAPCRGRLGFGEAQTPPAHRAWTRHTPAKARGTTPARVQGSPTDAASAPAIRRAASEVQVTGESGTPASADDTPSWRGQRIHHHRPPRCGRSNARCGREAGPASTEPNTPSSRTSTPRERNSAANPCKARQAGSTRPPASGVGATPADPTHSGPTSPPRPYAARLGLPADGVSTVTGPPSQVLRHPPATPATLPYPESDRARLCVSRMPLSFSHIAPEHHTNP